MKEVEAGNVEYLCIKDMSRMGRDYLKVGQIMEIPVSYTHLDVYKRQSQFHSGKGFCKESRICQRLSDAGHEGHGGRRDCHR